VIVKEGLKVIIIPGIEIQGIIEWIGMIKGINRQSDTRPLAGD
jgi:hypothetical protein